MLSIFIAVLKKVFNSSEIGRNREKQQKIKVDTENTKCLSKLENNCQEIINK